MPSKKCSHERYICDQCGSCCSHKVLLRRESNLLSIGRVVPASLKVSIKNKEGHLERGEYFCHKCGSNMEEEELNIFTCNPCKVTYDTRKYRFTREHKNIFKNKED